MIHNSQSKLSYLPLINFKFLFYAVPQNLQNQQNDYSAALNEKCILYCLYLLKNENNCFIACDVL